jgi:SOUL heme-binding protein
LDSLPKPNDSRVVLTEVPAQKMAVIVFSGYRTQGRIKKKEVELVTLLIRDGIQVVGSPLYAGYNAPGTPPWMTRNEVMIEIQ